MYEVAAVILIILILFATVKWSGTSSPDRPREHFDKQFSAHGNITLGDADRLGYEHNIGATYEGGLPAGAPATYDNAGVVAQYIANGGAGGGPDVFLPNGRGITSSDSGTRGAFGRAEPSYNTPWALPTTGTNADEMLARRQQYRS